MLTWFPAPYPDESFYSVLCRYYLSTGVHTHSAVKEMLFGARTGIKMATIYPNDAVHAVMSRLPEGLFDCRSMILEHTPFLYYTRIYRPEERDDLLNDLIQGKSRTPTHLWRTFPRGDYYMRYCPLCAREDEKIYGEAYYHVEQQLPLSSVCVRHRCRLREVKVPNARLTFNNTFVPLSTVELDYEPDTDCPESEAAVSRLIWEYWKLPYAVGPTKGYNNLYQALVNSGCMIITRQQGAMADKDDLYNRLLAYHGKERTEQVFDENIARDKLLRIKRWEQLVPDRYIFIQAMLGIDTKTVFSETPIPDPIRDRLERYAQKGCFYTLRQLAARMGYKEYELNALAQQYGIEPFWTHGGRGNARGEKMKKVYVSVTESECEKIAEVAHSIGYAAVSNFMLDCTRYVLEHEMDYESAQGREIR